MSAADTEKGKKYFRSLTIPLTIFPAEYIDIDRMGMFVVSGGVRGLPPEGNGRRIAFGSRPAWG